jgi:hypothetical protein
MLQAVLQVLQFCLAVGVCLMKLFPASGLACCCMFDEGYKERKELRLQRQLAFPAGASSTAIAVLHVLRCTLLVLSMRS